MVPPAIGTGGACELTEGRGLKQCSGGAGYGLGNTTLAKGEDGTQAKSSTDNGGASPPNMLPTALAAVMSLMRQSATRESL